MSLGQPPCECPKGMQMTPAAPLTHSCFTHARVEETDTPRYTVQPHAFAMPGMGMFLSGWAPQALHVFWHRDWKRRLLHFAHPWRAILRWHFSEFLISAHACASTRATLPSSSTSSMRIDRARQPKNDLLCSAR